MFLLTLGDMVSHPIALHDPQRPAVLLSLSPILNIAVEVVAMTGRDIRD